MSLDWKIIGEAAGAVCTIGGGGWAVWTKFLKPRILKSRKKKNELFEMINGIHSELRFNGGSSIKDAIWKLDKKTDTIIWQMNDMKETQKISMNLQGVAYWMSDEDGLIIYASPSLCKLIGRTESDILGNNWIACLIPEDRERIFHAWMNSINNKIPFDETYTCKRADGKYQDVLGIAFHKSVGGTIGRLEAVGEPVDTLEAA